MMKLFLSCISLVILLLPGCDTYRSGHIDLIQTPAPTLTATEGTFRYTDAQAEAFVQRLTGLRQTPQPGTPPDPILRKLGIDTSQLTVLTRTVGNCFDVTVYDLSVSYQLVVDDNACFGGKVSIEKRPHDAIACDTTSFRQVNQTSRLDCGTFGR